MDDRLEIVAGHICRCFAAGTADKDVLQTLIQLFPLARALGLAVGVKDGLWIRFDGLLSPGRCVISFIRSSRTLDLLLASDSAVTVSTRDRTWCDDPFCSPAFEASCSLLYCCLGESCNSSSDRRSPVALKLGTSSHMTERQQASLKKLALLTAQCLHGLYSTLGRDLTSIFLGPTLLAGLLPAVKLLDPTTCKAEEAQSTLSTDLALAAKATCEGSQQHILGVLAETAMLEKMGEDELVSAPEPSISA
ncbi:hypothetical protein WJX72_001423 [[Myrmecia] bisecta]|uniref:Uncharacterized protein n=1 Tax=[Myrmecia] bisecta TaxID=41462 RepID=A0AAW1P8D0_9CHLO